MIRELDAQIDALDAAIAALEKQEPEETGQLRLRQLRRDREELLALCRVRTPEDRVWLARHPRRPTVSDYIEALFEDFFEIKGDHYAREDCSILGGIALFHGAPVTVIGHRKGRNLEENMHCNFGMPGPEGFRKSQRLMKQAEKFGRPVITFIDTPGAYPGVEAEERGQSEAIARNLAAMSALTVPVVTVVTGEGSSGGALALGVANTVLMLENAVYSILSPEGFASILWKDASRSGEACQLMGLTAPELLESGMVDQVIPEPAGGAHRQPSFVYARLDKALRRELARFRHVDVAGQRYEKFRRMGEVNE